MAVMVSSIVQYGTEEIFAEITDTYKRIFHNRTECTQAKKEYWMQNLPTLPETDWAYLDTDFSNEEMMTAVKTAASFSAGGPDNVTNKMIQELLHEHSAIQQHTLNYFNEIKRQNHIPET